MKIQIVVNLQVEGIHHWPECDIPEVSFLRDKHRHLFKIHAKKLVTHADRDVEIIKLKRAMESYLYENYAHGNTTCEFGRMSCEQIAIELLEMFDLSTCEVLEDGENGAVVSR